MGKSKPYVGVLIDRLYSAIRNRLIQLRQAGMPAEEIQLFPENHMHLDGRSVSLLAQQLLDRVTADFLIRDKAGLLGFFRGYDSETAWVDELLSDMHRLALLRQEQVLEHLVLDNGPPAEHVRPWSHRLFAVVPNRAFGALWRDLQASRLTEEVGLSILPYDEELLKVSDLLGHPEILRFLAPLLFNVRAQVNEDAVVVWRKQLIEDLTRILERGETGSELGAWTVNQLQAVIGDFLTLPESTGRLEFISLEGVQLRRFQQPTQELPFGKLVILHGLNGTGKSSLLEAIELAMTGRLARIQKVAETQNGREDDLYTRALAPCNQSIAGSLKLMRRSVASPEQSELLVREVKVSDEQPFSQIDAYYLRQEQIRDFVNDTAASRYLKMVQLLGIPVEDLSNALSQFRHRVRRNYVDKEWSAALGKRLSPNTTKALLTFMETARTQLADAINIAPQLKAIASALDELRLDPDTRPAWARKLESLLREGVGIQGRLTQLNAKVSAGLETESATAGWAKLVSQFRAELEAVSELGSNFSAVAEELQQLLAPVRAAILAARIRLKRDSGLLGEIDHMTDFSKLQVELADTERAHSVASGALHAVQAAKRLVDAAVELHLVVQKVEDLSAVKWPERPKDWRKVAGAIVKDVTELAAETAEVIHWQGRFVDHERVLGAHIRALHVLKERLRQQITRYQPHQLSLLDEGDLEWTSHETALRNFMIALGVPEPVLSDPPNLEATLIRADAMERLVKALSAPIEVPDHIWHLLNTLARYHNCSDNLEECGIMPLLRLLDAALQKEEQVRQRVQAGVKDLLTEEIQRLWLELVWTLTAHSWHQPRPGLNLEKHRSEVRAHLTTVHGPAAAVFNLAEQHILALAWFLVSYLLIGRHLSNTIVLDDPFQFMDDANLSTFLRSFDEVIRAIGADQVVVAVHQPSVVEYLRHGYGGEVIPEGNLLVPEPKVVLWEVSVSDPESSIVRARAFRYRTGLPPVEPHVEPMLLGR